MKRLNLIGLAGLLVLLVSSYTVTSFDLVEGVRLHSSDRQEARVDDHWLVVEDTDSVLNGFLSKPFVSGFLDVFYEGHNLGGDYFSVDAYVDVLDVYDGSYGWHFTGNVEELVMGRPDKTGYDVFYDVAVSGFYNPMSKQIYTSFVHSNFGMTWVTFMNQGVMALEHQRIVR